MTKIGDDPFDQASYAGFGDRFLAWLIDWALLLVVRFAILLIWGAIAATMDAVGYSSESLSLTGGLLVLLSLYGAGWIYYAAFESSRYQATLGKNAMRLKVTDLNQGRPTFLQASFRFFFRLVSAVPLGAGFFFILFTKRRQALHDIGANCLVLRVERTSAPVHPAE